MILVVLAADGILLVFGCLQETVVATRSFQTTTPLEALLVEQALALAQQLQQTATEAPDGQVLAQVEAVAVPAGRELVRRAVEATLQAQAAGVEQKGPRRGGVLRAASNAGPREPSPATS